VSVAMVSERHVPMAMTCDEAPPAWSSHAELSRQVHDHNVGLKQRKAELEDECLRKGIRILSLDQELEAARQRAFAAETLAEEQRRRADEAEEEADQLRLQLGRVQRQFAEQAAGASKHARQTDEEHSGVVAELRQQLANARNISRSALHSLREMQAQGKAAEASLQHTQELLAEYSRRDGVPNPRLRDLIEALRLAELDFKELRLQAGERDVQLASYQAACRWCHDELPHRMAAALLAAPMPALSKDPADQCAAAAMPAVSTFRLTRDSMAARTPRNWRSSGPSVLRDVARTAVISGC